MRRAALFLDRDGVINEDLNYVHRVEDFRFIEGIFALCRRAKRAGMLIIVVTNQAGIGRGYYTEYQFHDLNNWMVARFLDEGVVIDGVYFCPFHPVHGIGGYKMESQDRKPGPGMILRASAQHGIDLQRSVLIGDKATDIAAAKHAGVGTSILFSEERLSTLIEPDLMVGRLGDAANLLFPTVD